MRRGDRYSAHCKPKIDSQKQDIDEIVLQYAILQLNDCWLKATSMTMKAPTEMKN